MPQAFLWQGKTTAAWKPSRFGMTFSHLTDDLGGALWMWSLGASPAPTYPAREKEPGSTAKHPECGSTWLESWATYDPSSSSWRTHQFSLLGGLESFSETWPRSGLMRHGECYPLKTLARTTSENESGLWQTPVADDAVSRKAGKWNSRGEPKLSAQVQCWPTPTASLGTKGGRITPRKGREGGTLIEAVSARAWPTPRANDGEKRGNFDASNPRNGLAGAARLFPTATARDWRSGKASEATHAKNSRPLSEFVGGLLNPTWVEWLMGWPVEWTACEPLATDKYHEWRQQHLPSSSNNSFEEAE